MWVAMFPDAPLEVAAEVERIHRATFGSTLHIGNRIPSPRPAEFGNIVLVGGQRRDLVTDVPTLAVEAWAATRTRASALAQELRAILHALEGRTFAGLTVADVSEFAAPGDLPDVLSDQQRYTATYAIGVRSEVTVNINL